MSHASKPPPSFPVPKKSPSCFNDDHQITLTCIVMKCFKRLHILHIMSVRLLPPEPFLFAYISNHLGDHAISPAIHSALKHLESQNVYVKMLVTDFSSALIPNIPQQLTHKLDQFGLYTSLCNCLLDFKSNQFPFYSPKSPF